MGVAEGAVPVGGGVDPATADFCRSPKRIEDDEEGIAPRPSVVILEQTGLRMRDGIAGVKVVGLRVREVAFSQAIGPDRHLVVVATVSAEGFAVVIAQHEKEG